ncbi:monovalent cation:H+ antiporter, CPA1 (nhx1) [Rhizophlyctis rosea]|nr:monovalent cation:H+ antiporter, CPA1 (nhx1) [Rhizophlyctis rosea]
MESPTASPSPSPLPESAEDLHSTAWAILLLISLLLVILLTSYYLQLKKIRVIHETVVSIVLGMVVGLVVHFAITKRVEGIEQMLHFDHRYFFNLLLPPIILNSGYDMKRKSFFRNFGSILTFALLGTMISTIVIGFLVWVVIKFLNAVHWYPVDPIEMVFLDCIVFGAILSSTDPVTILAIFHQLKVDPKLYAIIFGESILNDSVAIVLFETLGQFRDRQLTFGNLLHGAATFVAIFTGSVMVGIIIALICALMLKHSQLHQYPALEACIITLMAYASYLLSTGIQLSGIVSLLFCGITMKHYAYDNMSVRSRRTTKYMFRVLSQLSENFVFIYLGVAVFTNTKEVYAWGLIFFTLIICLVARYVSVVPLAMAINAISRRIHGTNRDEIPRNHQLMLWWAGLRGAIAFALSFQVSAKAGQIIRPVILVVCIVTVILLGGTTNLALTRLKIRTGVGHKAEEEEDDDDDAEDTDSSDDEAEDWDDDLPGAQAGRTRQYRGREGRGVLDGGGSPGSGVETPDDDDVRVQVDSREVHRSLWDEDMSHWFMSFDNRWLKPLFTRSRSRKWRWGTPTQAGSRSPTREGLLPREERRGSGRAFGVGAQPAAAKTGRAGRGGAGLGQNRGGSSAAAGGRQTGQNSPTPAGRASRFGTQIQGETAARSPTTGGSFAFGFKQQAQKGTGSSKPGRNSLDDDESFQDVNGDVWARGPQSPGRRFSGNVAVPVRPLSPAGPGTPGPAVGTPGGLELSGLNEGRGGNATDGLRGGTSGGSSGLNLFGLE